MKGEVVIKAICERFFDKKKLLCALSGFMAFILLVMFIGQFLTLKTQVSAATDATLQAMENKLDALKKQKNDISKKLTNAKNNKAEAVKYKSYLDQQMNIVNEEIEYFFNGSGAYLIDGCSYDIAPHMLFSVSTINFHEMTLSNAEYINISFSPDVIAPELLSSLFVGSHSCALRIPEKNVCFVEALLFEMLHTYQENDMLYLTRLLETDLHTEKS